MAQNKTQSFELDFQDGLRAKGETIYGDSLAEIRCLLPHLNPGAQMHYKNNVEGRTSCIVIGDATVLRIENDPEQKSDEPLRVRLILKLVERNFTTLPDVGKMITLLPRDSVNAIEARCVRADTEDATFCVIFEIPHIVKGKTVVLSNEDGDFSRVKIDSARLTCLNSGVDTSDCIISISQVEVIEKTPEPVATTNTAPHQDIEEDTYNEPQTSVDDSAKAVRFSVSDRTKVALQMIIGALFLANLLVLVAPTDGCAHAATVSSEKGVTTVVQSSVTSSEAPAEPLELAHVMVVGDPAEHTIPMNAENLRAFFYQQNIAKMPGSITGEVEPNSLGIFCEKSPVYDMNEKTSDVSSCRISIPANAKQGTYALTQELSESWFHQEDQTCFVEAVLPYYSSPDDVRNGLRINVESCEWSFDPSRKCFDYSKCTFTVPHFTAE